MIRSVHTTMSHASTACIVFSVLVLFTPDVTPAPTRLAQLIQAIHLEIQPEQAMNFMQQVYSTDRWFTFPKFQETAEYLKQSMKGIGLEDVELSGAPADGSSQFGFWTMPLAWDVKSARLEIVDPPVHSDIAALTDYQKIPASLGMWSGATPPEGVMAEVVSLSDADLPRLGEMHLTGKLVLLNQNPAGFKWALVKSGALGAINTFTENPSLENGRQWINAWGDQGWGFTKGSTPLLSFSISPREGALVRKLLAERGVVRVRATVDSRYYSDSRAFIRAGSPGQCHGRRCNVGIPRDSQSPHPLR